MMAGYTYDREASERRINAYCDFLMAAYGTDAAGLADIAGIPRGTMTKFMRADYDGKSAGVLQRLGLVTGISFSWLFAEQPEAEGVA